MRSVASRSTWRSRSGSVAKSRAVRSSWLRVKRLTPGVPAVVMAVMELLLFSGLGVGMCGVATHSGTHRALGQVQVEVDAVVCRVAGEGGAHGFVSGVGGRSLRWSAGLVRGWDQAQQQHRMTPQHMEAMCMAVTAVVEDMSPVQHEAAGGRPRGSVRCLAERTSPCRRVSRVARRRASGSGTPAGSMRRTAGRWTSWTPT